MVGRHLGDEAILGQQFCNICLRHDQATEKNAILQDHVAKHYRGVHFGWRLQANEIAFAEFAIKHPYDSGHKYAAGAKEFAMLQCLSIDNRRTIQAK